MKLKKFTVDELFNKVWGAYWCCERFTRSGHAKEVKWGYEKHIKPVFGNKLLIHVTKIKIREWHQKLSKHPFAANRALEILSTMFNKAIEDDHWLLVNPCNFVKPFVEKRRNRKASAIEIQKIVTCLYKYESRYPVGVAFLLTLLYSGARPRALERAKHDDLRLIEDTDEATGYGLLEYEGKSTPKTGEYEKIVFAPLVMEMISKLPRRSDGLIFGIKMPRDLWRRVRKEVGCNDLWARDLRRTFATLGRKKGVDVSMDTISKLLNHQSIDTTEIYAKEDDEVRVHAVARISDRISSIINQQKTGVK
jgi:integrase